MPIDRCRAPLVLGALLALGGCAESVLNTQPGDTTFGESNRQTMMAQVVNPDPVYTEDMVASGEHAGDAVQRYRDDAVKQPERVRTSDDQTDSGS